jgi:hypothetical protein
MPAKKRVSSRKKAAKGAKRRAVQDSAMAMSASEADLAIGDKVPNLSEKSAVGAATTIIERGTPAFKTLVRNVNPQIVFKDEEKTAADRMMTPKMKKVLDALAILVAGEWTGVKLRVTEAWDENKEHGTNSLHYEGRAADLTTFPVDGAKHGRLARLAVNAGLDWVFFEDASHVHVSMKS